MPGNEQRDALRFIDQGVDRPIELDAGNPENSGHSFQCQLLRQCLAASPIRHALSPIHDLVCSDISNDRIVRQDKICDR